jgi:hypothetical protein
MLNELGSAELSDALTCVRHSLAQMPVVETIDAYLTSIPVDGVIVRDTGAPTKFLRDVITIYPECLTPDAIERLRTIPLFCHDQPICNAVARRSRGGGPFVLIYSGLLAVAGYRQSLAILASNLELMLERKSNDVERGQAGA